MPLMSVRAQLRVLLTLKTGATRAALASDASRKDCLMHVSLGILAHPCVVRVRHAVGPSPLFVRLVATGLFRTLVALLILVYEFVMHDKFVMHA